MESQVCLPCWSPSSVDREPDNLVPEGVETLIQQDRVVQEPKKRKNKTVVRLQKRLQALCKDRANNSKSIEKFLRGVGENIRLQRFSD